MTFCGVTTNLNFGDVAMRYERKDFPLCIRISFLRITDQLANGWAGGFMFSREKHTLWPTIDKSVP